MGLVGLGGRAGIVLRKRSDLHGISCQGVDSYSRLCMGSE